MINNEVKVHTIINIIQVVKLNLTIHAIQVWKYTGTNIKVKKKQCLQIMLFNNDKYFMQFVRPVFRK